MHDEIRNELEGYLSGEVNRSFARHLEECPPCAGEVEDMKEVSEALHCLRADAAAFTPDPGFYARLAQRIDAEEKTPLWGLFAPDLQFFRKVAFASLMMLAMLGSYMVSRQSDYGAALDQGRATLTEHNSQIPHDSPADRQHIMVTLATYDGR
jgi:anti-sigma factor RsiW